MKKCLRRILAAVTSLALLAPACAQAAEPADDMRGIWVSSVYNLDYPSKAGFSVDQMKQEAIDILENARSCGLNTIFLQVRPTSDALYESDLFPWSHWLTGTQGKAPADGFDPLEYWVTEAHKRGLELHAWLNPYRITRNKNWDELDPSNPAKLHEDWAVKYTDDNYYYDPGLPEVRQLVVDGAVEIVKDYDVDGIHLDDYFYPGTDFNDAETYQQYGSGFDNIADWRRDNVNQLVSMLDKALHEADADIAFGISPAGIWANKTTDPRGSDTRGNESYASAYADSLAWIEAGTIDYIIPQIYWEIGHKAADFAVLTDWWAEHTQNTDVKLYIGIAAYKCHDNKTPTWKDTSHIFESLEYMSKNAAVSGAVFFRYGSLVEVEGLQQALMDWYQVEHLPDHPEDIPENAFPAATTGFAGNIYNVYQRNCTVKGQRIRMIDQQLAVYENGYPVTFGHIDNRGIARPSALFDMMQDAATAHAEALHLSPQDLGAFWVLSRLHCTVTRPIYPHEVITIRTWCAGIKGASWLRAFALSIDGQEIGQAISSWVVLDREDHHILRPNRIPAAQDYMELAKVECPPVPGRLICGQTNPHHVHTVRYSDLDINGHMNNVKIVDVVCDGLELERQENQFISEIQVNYTSECMPGEAVQISSGTNTEGTLYIFAQAENQPRFEAMAKLSAWGKKEDD